jgi:hypothetical protein
MAADLADRQVRAKPGSGRTARVLGIVILALLTLLAVEVLLEAWLQEILGNRYVRTDDVLHRLGGEIPTWPKLLKNGLLVALVVASLLKVTVERRWRDFTTRADLAFASLGLIMVLAGLFGTSGPVLIGQAVFVYFRGAIVFYAVRALRPSWQRFRWVLWAAAAVIAVDVLVALVQMVAGRPAYSGVGWVDLRYAAIHRAHGLLDHPNHLGHVLGLVLIGMLAWMTGMSRVTWKWWAAFTAGVLGLAATQSRESMIATVIGAVLVWFLRKGGGRTMIIACTVVSVVFLSNMLVRPENFSELMFRLRGVADAVSTPSGTEDCSGYETIEECTNAGAAPSREIRALFFQQGAQLLLHRPLLGYGVGQFGGVVAEQNDPDWEKDPRFGPGGFHLYDFSGTTVDSFWLHLAVEVGLLGLTAYLIWLYLLVAPLVRRSPRYRGVRDPRDEDRERTGSGEQRRGVRDPRDEDRERTGSGEQRRGPPPGLEAEATALWAVGSLVFAALVAVLSPALEDPLFPPLVFGIVGIAWVLNVGRGERPEPDTTTQPVPSLGDAASSPTI